MCVDKDNSNDRFAFLCQEVERMGEMIASEQNLTDEKLEAMSYMHLRLDEAEAQFAAGGGIPEDKCRQKRHSFIQNLIANDTALV